jgi:hypothetical protein
VLQMKWFCDVCSSENVCDVPREAHFFGVILLANKDHASINPSCEWRKIRVSLLHPPRRQPAPANPDAAGFAFEIKEETGRQIAQGSSRFDSLPAERPQSTPQGRLCLGE